jgi:hypothetical protein
MSCLFPPHSDPSLFFFFFFYTLPSMMSASCCMFYTVICLVYRCTKAFLSLQKCMTPAFERFLLFVFHLWVISRWKIF